MRPCPTVWNASLITLPFTLLVVSFACGARLPACAAETTILGIDGTQFSLDGQKVFLLGLSYYGGLGASEEFVRRDLDDAQRHGFNWFRVWATWESRGNDVSAVDTNGQPRQPYMDRLVWLIGECDRRGLVVDVTLARGQGKSEVAGGRLPNFASHQRAVEAVVKALKQHRNWYLDLANERDVRDDRYVSPEELKTLRQLVRRIDPARLVTASFGGHDLTEREVRDALLTAELDFLCPHRPRHAQSPAQTEAHTRECLALSKQVGPGVPVHYQEPFRRGYTGWEPTAGDFLVDLGGAVAGGAAGWCFHNGSPKVMPDKGPHRSFDLRTKRLFDQFDVEEQKVVHDAAAQMRSRQK